MCRAEGPEVEQFARQHADSVRVVGLGTQDSAAEAVEFIEATGTFSFPMYWDETFESWQTLGVTSQPAAVLVDEAGAVLGSWSGMFPIDEVLSLADAAD